VHLPLVTVVSGRCSATTPDTSALLSEQSSTSSIHQGLRSSPSGGGGFYWADHPAEWGSHSDSGSLWSV